MVQNLSVLRMVTAGFLALGAACATAQAKYRLAAGDVLEISAINIPDLHRRVPVDVDGFAVFPLIGPVPASGLTLAELRAKVAELLPTKVMRRKAQDGRDVAESVSADELLLEIEEYRPVYLDGDVAKPGAQPFRPGLTVREAIALAGGFDVMRFHGRDPFLESAELRGEYVNLWTEFAREKVIAARIEAELADRADLDRPDLREIPIPAETAQRIVELETSQLAGRNADYRKELDYLTDALAKQDQRISTLSDRLQKEQQGAETDARTLSQMRESFQKGLVPMTRLDDARRFALFSSTQALQIAVQVETFQRERQDLARRREHTRDQHQTDLKSLLEETHVKIAALATRIQSVGEKLLYAGIARSQLVRGSAGDPRIVITRRGDGGVEVATAAAESASLQPGDVVEVSLRLNDALPGAAAGH
jgi:polysaccharide biosynthesis/export protein